ncbi:MAG: DUF1844 domain-containing protein [Nitrospinaceae bacterium]
MTDSDNDSDIEGEGFIIRDKRSSQLSEEEAREQKEKEQKEDEKSAAKGAAPPKKEEEAGQFQIDFSTFVLSLTSSAFYHLGDMPDPTTGKTETNLPAVQQTIDMLLMLREKTQGNLSEDESKLMEQLIYELQMKFIEKNK